MITLLKNVRNNAYKNFKIINPKIVKPLRNNKNITKKFTTKLGWNNILTK
jgi:hypothetical protein